MAAPPPPPPPPMPGFGGPPPPPPPPGSSSVPARPPPAVAKDRGALLTDITKGARLKKAVTNDRSAPAIGTAVSSSAGPPTGAPPIPGIPKPSGGLAPPVSGAPTGNRGRSNSDTGSSGGDNNAVPSAPQLGGIFAGVGMPKLKKTGGVNTGAVKDSFYASDPETSQPSAPKPPSSSAPKPPTAPKINALRPKPQTTESSPPQPANPLVANLRKPPPRPLQRPNSSVDVTPPKAPPPLPGSSRPPPPPVASRKPSAAPPPPPPPSSIAPTPPSAPPPPPSSAPRPPTSSAPTPPAAPPPPPSSAPKPPLAPRTATTSNSFGSHSFIAESQPSLAMQAARNAFGNGPPSPAAPPPPTPPVPSPSPSRSSAPSPPSAPPFAPPPSQPPTRPRGNSNLSSLPNGTGSTYQLSSSANSMPPSKNGMIKIEDSRWRFQDESQLPKPREFVGFAKKYRAGRGSSVPLDLSQF